MIKVVLKEVSHFCVLMMLAFIEIFEKFIINVQKGLS